MNEEKDQNQTQVEPRNKTRRSHDQRPTIAIIISVVAIFIAWLPFYYQYIRIDNNAKATILSFAINHPEKIGYVSDVVFINNGNRPCSIASMSVQMKNIDTQKEILSKALIRTPCSNQSPFTINPKEVITKQLWASEGGIQDEYFNSYGKIGERLVFSLIFEIVDSEGKLHNVEGEICFIKIGEKSVHYLEKMPKRITLLPSLIEKRYAGVWPRKIEN